MNVEITKEEYLDLLDLLHIASWVLVAHKTEEDPRTKKYDKIIQKFYALAEEMGSGNLIEHDSDAGKYYPTREFEERSKTMDFIDEFVGHAFWDELIIRLAERDAARQVGGYEQLNLLSHEDRHALEDPAGERYIEEFNENGIDRLEIVERFVDHDTSKPVRTHD
ncbi:MAG: hypothetical protein ACM3MD_12065 [Betaproteobacteria bacterium]